VKAPGFFIGDPSKACFCKDRTIKIPADAAGGCRAFSLLSTSQRIARNEVTNNPLCLTNSPPPVPIAIGSYRDPLCFAKRGDYLIRFGLYHYRGRAFSLLGTHKRITRNEVTSNPCISLTRPIKKLQSNKLF
jgi:hypothetical protein